MKILGFPYLQTLLQLLSSSIKRRCCRQHINPQTCPCCKNIPTNICGWLILFVSVKSDTNSYRKLNFTFLKSTHMYLPLRLMCLCVLLSLFIFFIVLLTSHFIDQNFNFTYVSSSSYSFLIPPKFCVHT